MSVAESMKTCTKCNKRYPETTEYFYQNTSRGRKRGLNGKPYLRGNCKKCERERNAKAEAKRKKTPRTDQEKARRALVMEARRAAIKRIITKYEEEYKVFYAQELMERDIKLKNYRGVELRKRAPYTHYRNSSDSSS